MNKRKRLLLFIGLAAIILTAALIYICCYFMRRNVELTPDNLQKNIFHQPLEKFYTEFNISPEMVEVQKKDTFDVITLKVSFLESR